MLNIILPHFLRDPEERLPKIHTPALNQILRFARVQAALYSTADLYQTYLCNQLTLPEYCAYASPLSQQVGMNNIVVQHGSSLDITPNEAQILCAGLNQFYGEDAQFTPIRPDLWQIKLSQPIDWKVENIFNLHQILNPDNAPNDWLQLSTEAQMWLHSHPINQNRKPCPINALWFWNAPTDKAYHASAAVATDSAWTSRSSLNIQPLPDDFQGWRLACENHKIDLNETVIFSEKFVNVGNAWTYADTLAQWDAQFFAPVWADLCSGSLKNVRIVCEKNTLTVSSQARFAFWKRLKSFDGKQF